MIPLTLTLAPVDESAAERERHLARWIGAYRNMVPSRREMVIDELLSGIGIALRVLAVQAFVEREDAQAMAFDPCDFGGYLDPPGDAYTKRTCLWTSPTFVFPPPKRVIPVEGSRMHFVPPGPERADIRSATPMGFARAVYEANRNPPLRLFADGAA